MSHDPTSTRADGQVGIFARTFPRTTADEVAAAVATAGFAIAQFNFSAVGAPTLAPEVSAEGVAAVGRSFRDAGVAVWGLSATYNVIDPDPDRRDRQTRQAARLIGLSPLLGVTAVTLCTGTRNTESMWAGHPDNHSPAAWADLRATLDTLTAAASDAGIRLGIEPEPTNVVDSAAAAHRLIRELGPDARHIGIVLDPANLVSADTLTRQDDVIGTAFDLLGDHIIGLQAKDRTVTGATALGHGDLDHRLICDRTIRLGRPVPVIIQDATESDARRSGTYLSGLLDAARRRAA